MENLVIKLEVDLGNSNQVADAIKLLTPFNVGSIEVKDAEVLTPSKPKKKKAAEPTKAEAAEPTKVEGAEPTKVEGAEPTKVEAPEPTKAEAAEPTKAEAAEPTKVEGAGAFYKIEDVRQEVAKKAINNREEVKAKLTELGANNVSSLDPNAYGDFMIFLKSLK